jgi:hypothetical protein
VAHIVTLLAVILGWVFFRADSFAAARIMLEGMAGLHGAALPAQLIEAVPMLAHLAQPRANVAYLADGTVLGLAQMVVLLATGFAIVLLLPNLHQMTPRLRSLLLLPSFAFTLQRVLFGAASEFLYFRF